MKPLLWFRLYAEIVDDVKLLTLAPSDRWFYVGILACKAQGLLDGEDASRRFSHVQIKLRLTEMELEEAARRLAEAGLIEESSLQPLKWEKRQFRSDHDDRSSAERVRSWREKRRNQTVTAVTPTPVTRLKPRTETETETETENRGKKKEKSASPSAPSDVSPQVWQDWKALRKAKRAAVTSTAVAGIRKEAEKAGLSLDAAFRLCCERGWAGFKAEWVAKAVGGRSKYEEQADRVIRMLDREVIDG